MLEYKLAAIIRNRMLAATLPVSPSTPQRMRRFNLRRAADRNNPPSAPIAPASIGVNQPV